MYGILRRELSSEFFQLVTRVSEKVQSDGRHRLDVYIDKRTGRDDEVVAILKDKLPQSWYTREHVSYHLRSRMVSRRRTDAGPEDVRPQSLTVASWNIKSFGPKKNAVHWMTQVEGVSVLALQETWCFNDSWTPKLAGFTVYSVPAAEGHGKVGIALAVRRDFNSVLIDTSDNWIVCRVGQGVDAIFVVNVYIPSGTPGDHVVRSLRKKLESLLDSMRGKMTVILGDFNRTEEEVDSISWRLPIPLVRARYRGNQGTFHGFRGGFVPTAIDHVLVGPVSGAVTDAKVLRRWSDSDHWPVSVKINVGPANLTRGPRRVLIRQFSEPTANSFLCDNRWQALASEIVETNDPNIAVNGLIDTFQKVASENGLIQDAVEGAHGSRRCMTWECKQALRTRTKKLKTFLRTGRESDRMEFEEARKVAKAEYRASNKKSWEHQLEELRHFNGMLDSKKAWGWMKRFIKPRLQFSQGLPAILNARGRLCSDEEGKQEAWVEYYQGLFADPTGRSKDAQWWERFAYDFAIRNQERDQIDPMEGEEWLRPLFDVLTSLVNGKACGMDCIPPEWYKIMCREPRMEGYEAPDGFHSWAYQALGATLAVVADTCQIPEAWQTAEIVSIYKSGDISKPENYRGIALIPIGLKLLCSIIIANFNAALISNSILTREQAGFRTKEECVAQTASLSEICTRRRTLGRATYIAFIDFKKAYDMVPHEALFAKLRWAGFGGKFLRFLRALYGSSKMRPRGTSTSVPVERGLRQGCPMSPSLFNFFINDIFEELEGFKPRGITVPNDLDSTLTCPGLLFADDVVLFGETAEELQQSLAHIERWALRWGMECGVRKCGVMMVPTDQVNDPIERLIAEGPWQLHGQDIPLVKSYRYLGFEFCSDLEVNQHIAKRVEGAQKAFGTCLSFLANRSIPLHSRAIAYKTMVLPILTWGCELLPMNVEVVRPLDRLLGQHLRVLAGLRASSNLGCPLAMGIELGIPPVIVRVKTSRVRLYRKAPTLKTWLQLLCSHPCKLPTFGKRTWTMLTERFFKKRVIEYGRREEPFEMWLKDTEWKLLQNRRVISVALRRYRDSGFERGRQYMSYTTYNLHYTLGQFLLFRIRTGSFLTAQRLSQMGFISPHWNTQCPFCLADEPETVEHLLMRCTFFLAQRSRMFAPLGLELERLNDTRATNLLLGGELMGDNAEAATFINFVNGEPVTNITIDFLQSIYAIRQQAIQRLLVVWPPRVNAQLGTTVLPPGTEQVQPGVPAPQGVLVGRNPTYLELGSDL